MRRTLLIGAVLLLVLFAGVASAAERGGRLVLCHSVAPAPINPLITSSTISTNMSDLIFDPLAELDAAGVLHPALAERWERSPDGLTWTFHLRPGVRFHDGGTLAAADVAATYAAVQALPQGFLAFGLENLDRVEVVDPLTVRFRFKRFDAFFPIFLHLIRILPQRSLQEGVAHAKAVGTGPYRLAAFSDEGIALAAFDDHFRGRPYLDRVEVRIHKSQRACYTNFVTGAVDLAFIEDAADVLLIKDIPHISIIDSGMQHIHYLTFNLNSSLLKNKLVRQALYLGIDLGYIEKNLYQGKEGVVWNRGFFSGKMTNDHYIPSAAQALFAKAGYRDRDGDHLLDRNGVPLAFEVATAKGSALTARVLNLTKSAYERLGVTINIREYEPMDLVRKVHFEQDYDAVLLPIAVQGILPVQYLFWHSGRKETNVSSYANPEVDRLLDVIRSTVDDAVRRRAEQELAAVLAEDPPGIPLFVRETRLLVNDRYRGFVTDPYRFFSGLREVWVPTALQRPAPKE